MFDETNPAAAIFQDYLPGGQAYWQLKDIHTGGVCIDTSYFDILAWINRSPPVILCSLQPDGAGRIPIPAKFQQVDKQHLTIAANGNHRSGISIINKLPAPPPPLPATGGTITRDGDYVIHTFTANGTFGLLIPTLEITRLMVAGGGGGGYSYGGGGGAGGAFIQTKTIIQSAEITIGAGGIGGRSNEETGQNGGNTQMGSRVLHGGGGGGSDASAHTGDNGGSGGGGACITKGLGGTGTPGEGFKGGDGYQGDGKHIAAGGGGGAREAGASGTSDKGGDGGDGILSKIAGPQNMYAGGGGGGVNETPGSQNGFGGGGGGGNGSRTNDLPPENADYYGGGGGGDAGGEFQGGAGFQGIVIVRYFWPI